VKLQVRDRAASVARARDLGLGDALRWTTASFAEVLPTACLVRDIEEDIQFLGKTSAQLADSWGEVAESADMNSANAVSFPDAQPPFEAAQRIRAEFSQHGQEPLGC
jgi:hypothetical protein